MTDKEMLDIALTKAEELKIELENAQIYIGKLRAELEKKKETVIELEELVPKLGMEAEREKERADKQRIDWLGKRGFGGALVSDDNGHWAMVFNGIQNVPMTTDPDDISTTFFIEREDWQKSVRKAIDKAIESEK